MILEAIACVFLDAFGLLTIEVTGHENKCWSGIQNYVELQK